MKKRIVFLLLVSCFSLMMQAGTCIQIPVNQNYWQNLPQYGGRVVADQYGLWFIGKPWTNGALKMGQFDGNGAASRQEFDFSGGGDIYMSFSVNGAGKYMGIFPNLFSGVSIPPLSTHHSWAGSVVIQERMQYFAHLFIANDRTFRLTVSAGGYDNGGGSIVYQKNGTVSQTTGRVEISFRDNYGGNQASVVIINASACPNNSGNHGNQWGNGNGNNGQGGVLVVGESCPDAYGGWYVGTYPSKYFSGRQYCAIACDTMTTTASYKLAAQNFTHIEFGPNTRPACIAFVEANPNLWWRVSEEFYVGIRNDPNGVVRCRIAETTQVQNAANALARAGYPYVHYGPGTYADCLAYITANGLVFD